MAPEMVAPGLVARTVTPGRHSIEFRYVPYSGYPLLFGLGLLAFLGLHFGRRRLDLATDLYQTISRRITAQYALRIAPPNRTIG